MDPRTIKALAEITDEGKFEQLALSILQHAEPLCAALSQQGVNAAGRTRASPVDNIGFVRGATPPHLIAIHHTTAAERDLRAKWMATTGTSKARMGDIAKTAKIVAEERERTPVLAATLFLTTNQEPGEQLVRDATALGATHGITIDIWSRVRLARVLDLDPVGQTIRRTYLGIEEELLSTSLLAKLSQQSLATVAPPELTSAWISRDLDRQLLKSRRPVSFIIGESGSGKTVACLRSMRQWIAGGGFALVLTEDILETAASLPAAVLEALRRLHPALAQTPDAFSLASPTQPLLLLVEDINHAANPARVIEKLARWASDTGIESRRGAPAWRIMCPVWQRFINGLPEQARRLAEPMLVPPKPFEVHEGVKALEHKAKLLGHPISTAAALSLSTALGHDPLLIGLHEFGATSTTDSVIADFIERSLHRCESRTNVPSTELRLALETLASEMLQRRRMSPGWGETSQWPALTAHLPALRALFTVGEVVRLEGRSAHQKIGFRHDRVRDQLLVDAAAGLLNAATLDDALIADPFLAAVFGALLLRHIDVPDLPERIGRHNALALFHALRGSRGGTPERGKLTNLAGQWLSEEANRTENKRALRDEIAAVLMETEGVDVIALAKALAENTPHSRMACLRNGDLEAGVEDCLKRRLRARDQWRDRQIAHAKQEHALALVEALSSRLLAKQINDDVRMALLDIAGSVADPRLLPALRSCWASDTGRAIRLDDYLWAFSFCCDHETAEEVLGPLCAEWSLLPEERGDKVRSPKNEVADHEIQWAFARKPPAPAIDYLAKRGLEDDLSWQVYCLLHTVDQPTAIQFCAATMAHARARSTQWYLVNFRRGQDHWTRSDEEHGIHMSAEGRALLRGIWQDIGRTEHERITAFDLWGSSWGEADLGQMRSWQDDPVLSDAILRRRLERGDTDAIPLVLLKLEGDSREYWWQFTRIIWSDDLTAALRRAFDSRFAKIAASPDRDFDIDHTLCNAVIRLPRAIAEPLLLENWESISTSPQMVQTALYLATPDLLSRVAEAIAAASEPAKMFEYLTMHFGVRERGHPGLTRPEQITALEPYFDLIDDKELDWLADGCNTVGWFDLRRRLLDPRLPDSRHCWSVDRLPGLFDRLAIDSSFAFLDVEQVMEAGVEWDAIASSLCIWLWARNDEEALQLAADVLREHGRRIDLDMLNDWPGGWSEQTRAVVANAAYVVRHRTAE
ncbi:SAM-dependent methyltransferase [Sphingobium xenophagum]|uniref:SAM-dependent methyltransferase n=2 Tax=Sphingobium xenophagum TaxID=121428 RepID=A0ABU1X5J7_SPHXE|nr:SAM-dependent methyltransferase [Sphingobium xenophagum]